MFTLIKRELKTLFLNPISLAVISILNIIPVIVLAVFLTITQAKNTYAGFENVVSFMVIVFAVAIPLITILSVYKDKKAGNQEFVYSMPIPKSSYVLSKFFAQIIFFALPIAIMAIFPIVLKGFGNINLLHAYNNLPKSIILINLIL